MYPIGRITIPSVFGTICPYFQEQCFTNYEYPILKKCRPTYVSITTHFVAIGYRIYYTTITDIFLILARKFPKIVPKRTVRMAYRTSSCPLTYFAISLAKAMPYL